ncbi:hypothetical protein AB1Y20_007131 [Prymnesium parvum]|uniref:Mutator-like transposase domain-containing protein n=1 Tax=Prymnesium parvum TaxID=97485 RepID=A0AB34J0G2_PRYPA
MKPGKAMNAPDGYGVAIGGRTGKVVMTAYRTKVGVHKNHTGSSGSMEPAMGAEIVVRLGTEKTGVVVGELCMDLDSKTPKEVMAQVKAAQVTSPWLLVPSQRHDPNHFVKALRKRFMKVKKLVHATNVFPPATQRHLGDEVAMAIHQHRGSKGGASKLKAAIENVFQHAFNDHSRCREFFNCPCAPDEKGEVKRVISKYKDGKWLNEVGGTECVGKLRKLLEAELRAMTTDTHIAALSHDYNTQDSLSA